MFRDSYDIIVVGAGHAGCEAALASARLGKKTLLLTLNLDQVALMPCNPSIGGSGKAHLVREVDALGGEMGRAIDATLIQMRMLNTKKGPAVHALRAQADRKLYSQRMKQTLEKQPGLYAKEGMVEDLVVKGNRVIGVKTREGSVVYSQALVLALGTYLRSEVHVGDIHFPGAPQGQSPVDRLSEVLARYLPLVRFKTGTPPRISLRGVDTSKMEEQRGMEILQGFSYETESLTREQVVCYLTYTNEKTHGVITHNLKRSAMYSGAIAGTGPRYCPSIESKIVLFPHRKAHQIFLEPEGFDTTEAYVGGLSTSLPVQVQQEVIRTIPGLEKAEIVRPGYAIEYDCVDPLCLNPSLGVKSMEGIFLAGQINGTSGYEEAAAQGLLAGINGVLSIEDKEPLVLNRSQAYMGVLVDDLVTKGTKEPYRMMTSRAEYRLHLRQDNADARLTPLGYGLGLISKERYDAFQTKWSSVQTRVQELRDRVLPSTKQVNEALCGLGTSPIRHGVSLAELLRRPEVSYEKLVSAFPLPQIAPSIAFLVEMEIKYEGYIAKELEGIERFGRLEHKRLPEMNFRGVEGLSTEAKEKLETIKPTSLGQASRISGVSPADISVLMVHLEQRRRKEHGGRL